MNTKDRVRSFLGWAFAISALLHVITLPLFGLKAQAHEQREVTRMTIDRLAIPTPRPKPTPPPPTPQPTATPVPIHHALVPPPQTHRTIHVASTHRNAHEAMRGDPKYVARTGGNNDAGQSGPPNDATPSPAQTADVATAAPTIAPPPATPKPSCAKPNADASIKGQAIEPVVPDIARERGEAGTTEVEVTLDATGAPVAVTVHTSSGFPTLDKAAVDAAKATAYDPEIVECVKTAGSYLFRADFDSQ